MSPSVSTNEHPPYSKFMTVQFILFLVGCHQSTGKSENSGYIAESLSNKQKLSRKNIQFLYPPVLARGSCGGAGAQRRPDAPFLRHQLRLSAPQRLLAQDLQRCAANRVAACAFPARHLLPSQQGLHRHVHRYN